MKSKAGGLSGFDARQLRQQSDGFESHAWVLVLDEVFANRGPLSDLRGIQGAELAGFNPSDLVRDLVGVCGSQATVIGFEESFLKGWIEVAEAFADPGEFQLFEASARLLGNLLDVGIEACSGLSGSFHLLTECLASKEPHKVCIVGEAL
jgi:hypothetical protein